MEVLRAAPIRPVEALPPTNDVNNFGVNGYLKRQILPVASAGFPRRPK